MVGNKVVTDGGEEVAIGGDEAAIGGDVAIGGDGAAIGGDVVIGGEAVLLLLSGVGSMLLLGGPDGAGPPEPAAGSEGNQL